MAMLRILLLLLFVFVHRTTTLGTILQNPKSRLVPVGVEVIFRCKQAGTLNPGWKINNRTYYPHDDVERQGFYIDQQEEGSNVTLTLRMNATLDKNNTEIHCSSLFVESPQVILVVITKPVLPQNPTIANPNVSSISIQWSPPYLWPGQVIDYYTVSVVGRDGERTVHQVNATYSDAVVPFTITADHPQAILNCSELVFTLAAVKTYDDGHCSELASFNIKGGYIPNHSNDSLDVGITVLFTMERSPLLVVNTTFPPSVCTYERFNYSIVIEGGNKTTQHGPYQQFGPDGASQMIMSQLEGGREYSLRVVATTVAGVMLSEEHAFNTSLEPRASNLTIFTITPRKSNFDDYLHKVLYGVTGGVVVILLLLVLCVCCCILNQRKKKRFINSTNRVCNTMTHNPIYDGPVYDSIQPQFDTLTPTKTDIDTSTIDLSRPPNGRPSNRQNSIGSSDSQDQEHSPATDPRYVKQQSPHVSDHFRSKSFSSSQCSTQPYVMPISRNGKSNSNNMLQRSASVTGANGTCTGAEVLKTGGGVSTHGKLQLSIPVVQSSPNRGNMANENQRGKRNAAASGGGLDEAMASLQSAVASLEPAQVHEEEDKYTLMSPVVRSSAGSNCNGLELVHFRSDTVKFEE